MIWASQDSILKTKSLADSLINDLSKSTLDFINENLNFIFTTKNKDSIVEMVETYKNKRDSIISSFNKELSSEEIEILNYYNEGRLYGFLLFFGIVSKKIEAENSFYNFLNRIDPPKQTLKVFPFLYLYKYKIEYLRENESIEEAIHFLDYIENKVKDEDLSDYLKVYFLKELIEMSASWESYRDLLDVDRLNQILEREKNNAYYDILKNCSHKFLLTQKGRVAFDFKAEYLDGTDMYLADLFGKVVFIDVWATWCGPCIKARPKVFEMAKKFENNTNFEMLMVSVDSSKKKWSDFLMKQENEEISQHVLITDAMNTDFGKKYNISTIPRYILIDKKGLIVNAYLESPSPAVEKLIEVELSK